MNGRAVFLVALVVLAGCGSFAPTEDTTGPTTASPGPGTTDSSQTETSPTTTRSGTITSDAIWPDEPIVVAIDDRTNASRDWAPLLQRSLTYWEENASRFLGYPVKFDLQPDASDPDIRLMIVSHVTDCDGTGDVVGCAPYFTDRRQIDRPVDVQVISGLSDDSTAHVMTHELGHVLGLDHDDEPQSIMAAAALLDTVPKTNATERPLPWKDPELTMYVDYEGVADKTTVRNQLEHAAEYYETGADGTVPENVTVVFVDDPKAADVVVSFPEDSPCSSGTGSCGLRFGFDEDGDGALEYYTRLNVTVTGVGPEAVGWHVAYWLGYGLGFTEPEDWPDPLRNASAEERQSNWWE